MNFMSMLLVRQPNTALNARNEPRLAHPVSFGGGKMADKFDNFAL
jgi:hypothetical protein